MHSTNLLLEVFEGRFQTLHVKSNHFQKEKKHYIHNKIFKFRMTGKLCGLVGEVMRGKRPPAMVEPKI